MKRTGKKSIALLLLLALILSVCPMQAFATDGTDMTTITVENVSARPGTTVVVSVRVRNNTGILGATLVLTYDDGLTLQSAENGEAFAPLTLTKPGIFTSPCSFVWDGTDLMENEIKDGVILTLTFAVSPDAQPGDTYAVGLATSDGDVTDKNLIPVDVDITGGEISVMNFQYGDLDDNHKVNTTDVILLRRHLAGGYNVSINQQAADVDLNGKVNTTDVIYIRRHLAGGYGIDILPVGGKACDHKLVETPYKAATCTEAGNNAYYTCSLCGKYYRDAEASQQITLQSTVLPATGHHIVTVPGIPATETSSGLSDGTKCDICGTWFQEQVVLPMLEKDSYNITYDLNDYYLKSLTGDNAVQNSNPLSYSSKMGLRLQNIESPGYRFMGWYDMAGSTGVRVTSIPAGETGDITLYAHWEKEVFTVQLQSSLFIEESEKTYTVDRGVTLPTPKLSNYVFVGWTDEKGEMYNDNRIPAGTIGNLTLEANWTSERNKTYTKTKLDAPIIYEDEENNTILFAYEIGEIQNVPLYTIKDFGYISGDGVTKTATETYSTTITESAMQSYTKAVASATTESSDWTLSKDWTESTSIDEKWCKENGYTKEQAETVGKSATDTWNISNSETGSTGVTSVATNEAGWESYAKNSAEVEATLRTSIAAGVGTKTSATAGVKIPGQVPVDVGATHEFSTHLDLEVESSLTAKSGFESGYSSNGKALRSTSTETTSSWNQNASYGGSSTSSASSSVSSALSEKISSTYGYGKSYTSGGGSSASQGLSSTQSSSDEYASSVTYSKATAKQVTSTWTTQSTKPGYHRWVVAGTAHVFGVVGYDMAQKSYFVYTYSVMDDETHEFEDYSYTTASYSDHQNGVIPFEVPGEVATYVAQLTSFSTGLKIDQTTGTVLSYSGTDNCVVIPEYMNVGNGSVVKIRAIAPGAFKNHTDIDAIVLSDFITEIPNGAFEGCSSLSGLIGGSVTRISSNAFKGCTGMENCVVRPKITSLGENAFEGVGRLMVNAANEQVAQAAAGSGAKNIELHIENSERLGGADRMDILSFIVPEGTETFAFEGNDGTYPLVNLFSAAKETSISHAQFPNGIFRIASPEVKLNQIYLQGRMAHQHEPALVLTANQVEVGLQGTNRIEINHYRPYEEYGCSSDWRDCVLCKDVTFYEMNPNVAGKLEFTELVTICNDEKEVEGIDLLCPVGEGNSVRYNFFDLFGTFYSGRSSVWFYQDSANLVGRKIVTYGEPIGDLSIYNAEVNVPEGKTLVGWTIDKAYSEASKYCQFDPNFVYGYLFTEDTRIYFDTEIDLYPVFH